MKTLILSAGLGIRLKPLTNNIPKVMAPINGKPVLEYHIKHLKNHGIIDLWINLHWYPEVIQNYFGNGKKFGVKISYSYEKKLLGTAGALRNPSSGIEKEFRKETFLIVYGDNLTNFDHTKLINFHRKNDALLTTGLYRAKEPWTMGIVETNKKGKILRAVEKPPKEGIATDQVGAGVIVCKPEVLNYIPSGFSDFGFDIVPKLLKSKGSLWALNTSSYVQDTGTLERLAKAQADFKNGTVKFDFVSA